MDCPDPIELEAYLAGDLEPHDRTRVEQHLASCPSCRDRTDELSENLDLIARARVVLEPLAGDVAHPDRVGPFRVVREIGRGGMGIVYLAEQDHPRRRVALKVVRPGLASAGTMRRFEREVDALARLEHPGIARIFETGVAHVDGPSGWSEARPWFAMEYAEGERLDEWVRTHDPATRVGVQLIADIADAIHHAHVNGVVHRDLKPGNILVDSTADGHVRPKVLDFGIARLIDADAASRSHQTEVGKVLGTIPFMSPEQVTGDPSRINAKTDIYSIGVLAYWLLSGELPYPVHGRSLPEAARIIHDEEPTPLSAAVRGVDGDLATIVGKCLEKDPERRYAAASELAADIRRYLANQPIVARSQTATYQLRKLVARHRTPVVFASLLLVSLISYAITMNIFFRRARDAERTARRETAAAEEVATFLQRLFEAPNPWVSQDTDLTAREILEQGVQRIRTDLRNDPELQSRLLRTLGTTYVRLGDYDRGQALVEETFDLRRDGGFASADALAESTADLAVVASMRGEYERADSLGREAVARIRGLDEPRPEQLALALTTLGRVQRHRGNLAGAESLLVEAMTIWDTPRPGDGDLATPHRAARVTSTWQTLATLRRSQGRLDEAETLLRRVLGLRREVYGERHAQVSIALNNLAGVLDEEGDLAGAIELMQESLDIAREALGPGHPDVAKLTSNFGAMLSKHGDLEAAEPYMREALATQQRVLGDRHPDVAWRLHNLGMLLAAKGEPAEALPYLEEAISIRGDALPADHWTTAESRGVLGTCFTALERYEEAEPLLLDSYPVIRDKRGAEDRLAKRARQRIVDLYEAWGRPEAAAAYAAEDGEDRSTR